MHVGDPVALVVAETIAQAQDAAELVQIEYPDLPAVIGLRAALAPGAPGSFPKRPAMWRRLANPVPDDGSNAREIAGRCFRRRPHVARVAVVNQRLVVATMEPRGATANYDHGHRRYTLRVCSQSAGPPCATILATVMEFFAKEKLRVISEDVGGAFGVKTAAYPEYPSCSLPRKPRPAGRLDGDPLRSRSSATHARDTVTEAELAIDDNGRFLALRVRRVAAMGAFIGLPGANIQTINFSRCFPGMYGSRRSGGRAVLLHQHGADRALSRRRAPGGELRAGGLVDEAARITGIDRVRLRRSNLIRESDTLQDRRSGRPTTPATSRRSSTRRWRSPISRASSSAARLPRRRASCAASAYPASSSMRAARRSRARSVPRWRQAHARCSACNRPARAMPRCFRASSPTGSASVRDRSATATAIPPTSSRASSVASRSAMTRGGALS